MVDWGASFKLWMIFCSSENTVLVRLRARAVAASMQTSYGIVRGWHESKIATRCNQIGVQHTARILSRYQCARARWGHVRRQNISLIIKKTYG